MSLIVTFQDADAPTIGGIHWDALEIPKRWRAQGMDPDLQPLVTWLENYGEFGADGLGIYLIPTMAGPSRPDFDAHAGAEILIRLAQAWQRFQEDPQNRDHFARWDEIFAYAAEHADTPYVIG